MLILLTAAPLAGIVGLEITPRAKALAETGSCGDNGDNVTWKFDSSTGTLTISGTGKMKHYASGSPFGNNKEIKSVTIGRGVTSVAGSAFYKCTSLKSVSIGSSVTIIGERAFQYCSALANLRIPDSVTQISSDAFCNCTALANVTIGTDVTQIGYEAFRDCDALKSVTIPDNVTILGGYAFTSCDSLSDVVIGNGVTSINSSTFYGCKSLTSVLIGNSVTKIGGSAFSNCTALKNLTIGNSVTQIEQFAFSRCSALTSVIIPDNVTSIDKDAFEYCSALASITFGNSLTYIGSSAFNKCTSLKNVTIPDNVTTLGGYVFTSCTALTDVTIGNGVTIIGSSTFYSCKSLSNVTIGNSVTKIGSSAFTNCAALKTITIPKSVISIEKYAFSRCTALKDVYYTGTESQWNDLKKSIAGDNNYLINATIHYNSPGLAGSPIQSSDTPTVLIPKNLKTTSVDINSISITWDKISGATGYEVHQFDFNTKKYTKLDEIKTNSYKATELAPATNYYFAVRAYKIIDGKNYYSDYSTVLITTTKGTVPGTQTTIRSKNGSIKCTFMYGFDNSNEYDSKYYLCKEQLQQLSTLGMTTSLYNAPTVEDYKSAFSDSDYVCIFEHGTYIDSDSSSYFIVRGDRYSKEKYKDDLDNSRLKAWSLKDNKDFKMINSNDKMYFITPEFIRYYYSGGKLKNTVVYLFCCKGFGVSDTLCLDFAKAFEECGASATIGFYNTVQQVYGRDFFQSFTESLLNGKTVGDAYNGSVQKNKNNDYDYIKKYGSSFANWETPTKVPSSDGYYTWKQWLSDEKNQKDPGTVTFYGKKNTYIGAPNAPAELKAVKRTETSIQLYWDNAPKADGYVIYQYDLSSKTYKKIASTKAKSYIVKGLTPGTNYRFIIKSYRKLNKKTILSEKFALVHAMTQLEKPVLTIKAGKEKAVLSWNKVKGASKYSIFISKSKDGKYSLIKTTTERKSAVKHLKSGKTFYFKIRAYAKYGGERIFSNYSKVKAVTIK